MARRKNQISCNQSVVPSGKRNITFDEAIEMFLIEQKTLGRTTRTQEWHKENFHVLIKLFREQGIAIDLNSITTTQLKHNWIGYTKLDRFLKVK